MTEIMVNIPTLLFFPINGSGIGHLTRCLAYARRLLRSGRCTFFSLSSTMEVIEDMGFVGDYFVSPFWSVNSTYCWNSELAMRCGMMMENIRPDILIFDGTWPFQGLLATCRAYRRSLKLVWSNRGLLKKECQAVNVDASIFDLVIQPGEIGTSPRDATNSTGVRQLTVPPVTLFSDSEFLSCDNARRELGIPLGRKIALFSLGPGNLKDVSNVGARLIQRLQQAGFYITWACAPISVRDVELPSTVQPLSVYPLARYLRAFNVFVGAAGYNTCCEVAQAQIPSLIVPNTLLADDQAARARLLAQYAPVVVSPCETDAEAAHAVSELLELARTYTQRPCPVPMNGAELAAQAILRLAQE